jgi:4-amino-4-deoxy-L-arabinose transferase-like glycosyltransferase
MNRPRAALVAGLGLRLTLIMLALVRRGEQAFLVPDSYGYLALARSLACGAFRNRLGEVEVFRTPGYPLLLTPGVWMGAPVAFAIAVNLLLTIAIVMVTHALARRYFDEKTAGVCAIIVAIEPTLMTWSLKVMPETAFALALLLVVFFAARSYESPSQIAAVLLALAAYLRPIAYPLVFVICLLAFFAIGWRKALIATAICIALLAPWHLRNYALTGFAGFSSVMDRAVYLSAGGSVAAEREGVSYAEMRKRMLEEDRVRAAADPERQSRIRKKGFALIVSNPFGYAKTHVAGMARTLFDPGAAEYLRILELYHRGARDTPFRELPSRYPLVFFASLILGIALLPLVILPIVALTKSWRDPRFVLLAIIAGYLVFAGGGIPGNARFRAPAVPLLVLMSAFAKRSTTLV